MIVWDKMQQGYRYWRVEPVGAHFAADFTPQLTPAEMLKLGVFAGRYLRDCRGEFPEEWFREARMARDKRDPRLNFFGVDASLPLAEWRRKGWIFPEDPRGWFQWYCRYTMGRRIDFEDRRQINRWKAMRRHVAAIERHCMKGDWGCRPRQRQALLHWAYDSRSI